MKKIVIHLSIFFVSIFGIVACSSNQPLENHGDLSDNVACMERIGIKYEKRDDGFYMSQRDWDKFINHCS